MKKFAEFIEHARLAESTKFLSHIDAEAIEKELLGLESSLDAIPSNAREWKKFFDELDWWGKVIDSRVHGSEIEIPADGKCPFDYKKSPREFIQDFKQLKSNNKKRTSIEKAFWKAGSNVDSIITVVRTGLGFLDDMYRQTEDGDFVKSTRIEDKILHMTIDIQSLHSHIPADWYGLSNMQRFDLSKYLSSVLRRRKIKTYDYRKVMIHVVNDFPLGVEIPGNVRYTLDVFIMRIPFSEYGARDIQIKNYRALYYAEQNSDWSLTPQYPAHYPYMFDLDSRRRSIRVYDCLNKSRSHTPNETDPGKSKIIIFNVDTRNSMIIEGDVYLAGPN
jgi:hypothetical protein